ncbi:hypothetical protein F511_32546 [Dorcoceras hygrometricum]|uniref:Uncharacterized protein n=1 Tax=Dorcoceras hygrometricum TaxID=472368 RepID=A0A2Z7C8S4_9LAMI|nr:hypothetical protein F511_32546 [Dorcoceras hygrometricum]
MKSETQIHQIFVRFADPQIPTRSVIFRNPSPNFTIQHLKSSLFPEAPVPEESLFFTLNGKPLSDATPLFPNPRVAPLSTLTANFRLCGGGGDGGATGAESRDCYLNMYAVKKPDKADPNELRLSKWVNCSLSNEPLRHPVVIDKLGNLFNKEALVQGLLTKTLPKEFGYIKGLKDMIAVELVQIPGVKGGDGAVKFQCPISGLEFNGNYKFFAITSCGHVLSAKSFKEVKSSACLVCHKEFTEDDKIIINGSEDEVTALWEKLKEEKAKKDSGKKSKKAGHANEVKPVQSAENGKKHRLELVKGDVNGPGKKFKAAEAMPANATKAVYESIFTSSKKSNFKETYSCRSLPLGRN